MDRSPEALSGRAVRVVAGAIVRSGLLLAARRGPHHARPNLWELPGGKVEPGETDAAALARELAEELDVVVEVGATLARVDHAYPELTIHLVALRCTLIEGEPRALEHAELRWVSPQQAPALDWAPADRAMLDAVLTALSGGRDG